MTNTAFFTRSVLWRNTQTLGTDLCTLRTHPFGYDLSGTVVMLLGSLPHLIHYKVKCDKAGQTKEVGVSVQSGEIAQQLHLNVGEKRWWRGGREVDVLRGCVDVNLGVTPATNTLPIRRLSLGPGESQEVRAAWVRFPSLTIEPLPQRHTYLGEHHYGYESRSFSAELEVDSAGLITSYPDGWIREAQCGSDDG